MLLPNMPLQWTRVAPRPSPLKGRPLGGFLEGALRSLRFQTQAAAAWRPQARVHE
jgi:hypothetical protein